MGAILYLQHYSNLRSLIKHKHTKQWHKKNVLPREYDELLPDLYVPVLLITSEVLVPET
jgi:hypothetical protein